MKFQILLIITVCVALAVLAGCKRYQYARESDQYVNRNDFPKLIHNNTIKADEAFSRTTFSMDNHWLAGWNSLKGQLPRTYLWEIKGLEHPDQSKPNYFFDGENFQAFLPSFEYIALWNESNNTLVIRNLKEGYIQSTIPLQRNDCIYYLFLIENECGVTFSHDAKFVALRNESRRLPWNDTVEVYSTDGGPPVFELPIEYHESIAAVQFIPTNSNQIAIQGCIINTFTKDECRIQVWDLSIRKLAFTLPVSGVAAGVAMDITNDGNWIVSQGYDSETKANVLELWSITNGHLLSKILMPSDKFTFMRNLKISADNIVVSSGSSTHFKIFKIDSEQGLTPKPLTENYSDQFQIPIACAPIFKVAGLPPGHKCSLKKLKITGKQLGVECYKTGIAIYHLDTGHLQWYFHPTDPAPFQYSYHIIPGSGFHQPEIILDMAVNHGLNLIAIATAHGIYLMKIPA